MTGVDGVEPVLCPVADPPSVAAVPPKMEPPVAVVVPAAPGVDCCPVVWRCCCCFWRVRDDHQTESISKTPRIRNTAIRVFLSMNRRPRHPLGNRVVASRMEGVAAGDPTHDQPDGVQDVVAAERLFGVRGARRLESTRSREHG